MSNEESLAILAEEKDHLIEILKDPIPFMQSSSFRPICINISSKFFDQTHGDIQEESAIYKQTKNFF